MQPIISGQNGPAGVAVDASHLYWASQLDGTIWEASLNSASPSPQAFITGQPVPAGVAVTSSQLYWTDAGNGTINAINLNGSGGPQPIVTGQRIRSSSRYPRLSRPAASVCGKVDSSQVETPQPSAFTPAPSL